MRFLLRLVRLVVVLGAAVAVLSASVLVIAPRAAQLATDYTSDPAGVVLDPLAERSYIFDRYGNRMATLVADENRVRVGLDEISQPMILTVLAVEDENFYQHKGVNVRSIGRAFSANLESGGVEQGGSTITQQVVKNSIVGNQQSLSRKMREAFLAVELEKQTRESPECADLGNDTGALLCAKNSILERYLNTVYFGNGAYGVQAAAELYFTRNAKDLDWVQASLLTALIRSPIQYDPFEDPDLAVERRAVVLDVLHRQGHLTSDEADLLKFVALPLFPNNPKLPDDYFVEQVKQQLFDDPRLGATPTARYNAVFGGGLRVYTTFDPVFQSQAITARNETLPGGRGDGTFDLPPDPATGQPRFGTAAMVGIEPSTGAVRMVVGGPGFDKFKYDLATQGSRQPGSSFKTFVLATLLEQGVSPSDYVDGSGPCKIPGYPEDNLPGNFGNSRGGVGTITSQTLKSSNCAYLRLGQIAGLDNVAETARKMGITTELNPAYSSMPIGAQEVHPMDMAAAYAVLANDGVKNVPYFIDRVTDSADRVVFEHQATPQRVLSEQTARWVNSILEDNVRSGTGTRARLGNGQPAAGKTGTTNGASDVWFVGYTPQMSLSVWMGATSGRVPLTFGGGATGGRYPAATWGQLMSTWLADQPVVPFIEPEARKGGRCLSMPSERRCGSRSTRRPGSSSGGTRTPTTTPATAPVTEPAADPGTQPGE